MSASGGGRSDWNDTLRDVMHDVARQRELRRRPGPPTPRWQPALLVVLALAFLAVAVWNGRWYTEVRSPAFSSAELEDGLRATIFLTALSLEDHRARTGLYPASLADAGLDAPGLEYRRHEGGYLLEARGAGVEVSYRSGQDLRPFETALDRVFLPARRRGS